MGRRARAAGEVSFGWFCGRQTGKRRWGHALLRLGRHLRGGIVLACVAAVVVDVAGVATLLPVWAGAR